MREVSPGLLRVTDLRTTFMTEHGGLDAVAGVSLRVDRGEILGVVGESGSGKSALAMSITQLHDADVVDYSGSVQIQGIEVLRASERTLRQVRGRRVSMVFQDPQSSLNPLQTVGRQIGEVIKIHATERLRTRDIRGMVVQLIDSVGIVDADACYDRYPHQLSGGMKQRIMICIALAARSHLLIADEPTTALDVTVQAQILALIKRVALDRQMGVVFISHDLGVVAELCDRVAVMYRGEIVEDGPTAEVFIRPQHPYTLKLLRSLPHQSRAEVLAAVRAEREVDDSESRDMSPSGRSS